MTTSDKRKGRSTYPVRPGFIIKKTLQGEIPLSSGKHINEASISDLFNAYKSEVERINEVQRKEDKPKIKGMVHSSFYTLFRFARLLRLVEMVREESTINVPLSSQLSRVEKTDIIPSPVESNRKIFRLTQKGIDDNESWSDLRTAWLKT